MKIATRIGIVGVMATFLLTNCLQANELKYDKGKRLRQAITTTAPGNGPLVESGGEQYILLADVTAVRGPPDGPDDKQLLRGMGLDAQEVLERKAGLIIFRGGAPESARLNTFTAKTGQGDPLYPVVWNRRTGKLGVVLGTIVVKLHSGADAQAVATEYGLRVVRDYKHLGTAILQVAPGQEPFALAGALAGNDRVAGAIVEILENPAVPH